MPRPIRIDYEGAVYHVTSRGNERRKIFLDDTDRWSFLRLLGEMVVENKVLCHAWVLMGNHYHLMVETPMANLSAAMKGLNGIYTQKFNRRHQRVGHLFQGRFKAIVVEKDAYLKELCRYVVLNPVRAKIVKSPGEWKWSSYRSTAGLEKGFDWQETGWILGQFGKTESRARSGYRTFVADGVGGKESPWENLYSRIYLGGKGFLDKAHEMGGKQRDLDLPKYQRQVVKKDPEKLLAEVAKAYGEKMGEILRPGRRRSEAVDVAVYLLKKEAGMSLREIGERMGIGPTAVGNRWVKMKERLAHDKILAQKVLKWIMVA